MSADEVFDTGIASPFSSPLQFVAVVTTYRPEAAVEARLTALLDQVESVVVVDDGSPRTTATALPLPRSPRLISRRLDSNSGIGVALNTGIGLALQRPGTTHVLTLDQDTTLAPDYVEQMRTAIDRLEARGTSWGALAPGHQTGDPVVPIGGAGGAGGLTSTLEAIQSGLVIPAEVLRRHGGFDESLFIDCVDSDFTLRLHRASLPTLLVPDCRIEHDLGRSIDLPVTWLRRSDSGRFAYHPPWRRYYITRNRAVLLGRYGGSLPGWAASMLVGEAAQLARSVLLGPQPVEQLVAVCLGLLDALKHRSGRISSRWERRLRRRDPLRAS